MFGFLPFSESGCCYVKKHELCQKDVALIQTHLAKSSFSFSRKTKHLFSFVFLSPKFHTFLNPFFGDTFAPNKFILLHYPLRRELHGKELRATFLFFVCVLSCLLVMDSPTPIIHTRCFNKKILEPFLYTIISSPTIKADVT